LAFRCPILGFAVNWALPPIHRATWPAGWRRLFLQQEGDKKGGIAGALAERTFVALDQYDCLRPELEKSGMA
jgi:hypothetical protein